MTQLLSQIIKRVFSRKSSIPMTGSILLPISELAGKSNAYQLLNIMHDRQAQIPSGMLSGLMADTGLTADSFSELENVGLILNASGGFYLSSLGTNVTLLLRAINGDEDLVEVFNKIRRSHPGFGSYELIEEDITGYFIDSLSQKPDFIRLLICSPWIRLEQNQINKVEEAVWKAKKRYKNLQVLIISKPPSSYNNWKASVETFKTLISLGADVVTYEKLHAKLYISEPGPLGGAHYAIMGSENLTGRGNVELAIKIENDNDILRNLTRYFRDTREEAEGVLQSV